MKITAALLVLLVPQLCVAQATDVVPWKVNKPIVDVKKELHKKHPGAGTGSWVAVKYIGPKLEQLKTSGVERRSDVLNERFTQRSTDNGRTWSQPVPIASTDVYYEGKELGEFEGASYFDSTTGVLVDVWLRNARVGKLYHNFTYTRISHDLGKTWSTPKQLRYESGIDFNPKDPHNAEFLKSNQAYFGSNIIRHRNGTLIHVVAHTNAAGDPKNALRPWRMGSVCFIGTWDANAGDYNWQAGARLEISPDMSARGLMEPEVAELTDGRLLVAWRGSTTGWDGTRSKIPGRKFFSISTDGGRTFSQPAEWKYDDGSSFYSPSSIHRMIRHSVTGKLYWIGNICGTPPSGNSPRYPLVIAEVDEEKAALKKNTVTLIDDRRPDQPKNIQLSNFSLLENRETHALELYLTILGEYPDSVFTADCYQYTVRITEASK